MYLEINQTVTVRFEQDKRNLRKPPTDFQSVAVFRICMKMFEKQNYLRLSGLISLKTPAFSSVFATVKKMKESTGH